MEADSLKILFEDVHLIVLCKPAGLLSQGEHTGDQNLVDLLRHHFGRYYVGLIHRLDRNTSGIMVVAKRSKSADRLSQSLQSGSMRRSYLGWLEGELKDPTFQWEDWLTRDEKTKITRITHSQVKDAKKALLSGSVQKKIIFKSHTISLCEFYLDTGRAHQIRAQASSRGFPLLGDRKYGSKILFSRTALHSHRLEFPHPMTDQILSFECALPNDLALNSEK